MNKLKPIYTEKTECQDCYKCVEAGPSKPPGSRGSAQVIPEAVSSWSLHRSLPSGCKEDTNDLGDAIKLLKSKDKSMSRWLHLSHRIQRDRQPKADCTIMELGFAGVAETALGAQGFQLPAQLSCVKRVQASRYPPLVQRNSLDRAVLSASCEVYHACGFASASPQQATQKHLWSRDRDRLHRPLRSKEE